MKGLLPRIGGRVLNDDGSIVATPYVKFLHVNTENNHLSVFRVAIYTQSPNPYRVVQIR